jgi:hypothetical protein
MDPVSLMPVDEALLQGSLTYLMAAGLFLQGLIPLLMSVMKRRFPGWDRKAWAPLVIGMVTMLVFGLATGRVISWNAALLYALVGFASGGTASSLRDIYIGK